MLVFSGVGGYGYQTEDWYKHNAILGALIEQPWPVNYTIALDGAGTLGSSGGSRVSLPLVYYIAYYLPAAAIGKASNWQWANHALFCWTYLGLCLALLWFLRLVKRGSALVLLLFASFSGLDALGMVLIRKVFLQQPLHLQYWAHIERWSGNWQYPANITSVFWVPNQAISGWIFCGLLFSSLLYGKSKKHLFFVWSLTLLWSPFLTLGLLPYFFGDLLSEKSSFLHRVRGYLSWNALGGGCLFGALVLFYAARMYEIPLPLSPIANGMIFSHPIVHGLFWYETLGVLLLFLLLEFGIYGWLIFKSRLPLEPKERMLLVTSLLILAILPFFRYGFWNDLVMRASIPALFVVCIYVVKAFYSPLASKKVVMLLGLTFAIGSINSFVEFKRHVSNTYEQGHLVDIQAPRALYDAPNTTVNPSFFTQYIGSADSPFFRALAKPLLPCEPVLDLSTLSKHAHEDERDTP